MGSRRRDTGRVQPMAWPSADRDGEKFHQGRRMKELGPSSEVKLKKMYL